MFLRVVFNRTLSINLAYYCLWIHFETFLDNLCLLRNFLVGNGCSYLVFWYLIPVTRSLVLVLWKWKLFNSFQCPSQIKVSQTLIMGGGVFLQHTDSVILSLLQGSQKCSTSFHQVLSECCLFQPAFGCLYNQTLAKILFQTFSGLEIVYYTVKL